MQWSCNLLIPLQLQHFLFNYCKTLSGSRPRIEAESRRSDLRRWPKIGPLSPNSNFSLVTITASNIRHSCDGGTEFWNNTKRWICRNACRDGEKIRINREIVQPTYSFASPNTQKTTDGHTMFKAFRHWNIMLISYARYFF